MRQLERHLGTLASQGLLSGDQTTALLHTATKHLPQRLDRGLIHHDFCAENLILTEQAQDADQSRRSQGTLFAIDNEDMRVSALDADLARCFLRWPMSARERDAFLDRRSPGARAGTSAREPTAPTGPDRPAPAPRSAAAPAA